MATKATLRRSGRRLVTVKITAHLDALQLAALFWHGLYEPDWTRERRRVPAARVRQAVTTALLDNGQNSSYCVENDDDWEFKGGRDWALDQVMRVYGFTEDDLDGEDRKRRVLRRNVGDRVVNICRGQFGFGAHGTVTRVELDRDGDVEVYVKYDDGTTQKAPSGWLAAEQGACDTESEADR